MKPIRIILLGLAMLAFGGTLLFGKPDLPLWICWTVGPLCWYLGFAVTGTGVLLRGFQEFKPAEAEDSKAAAVAAAPKRKESVTVHRLVRVNGGPAGVFHEIPAMGGFIL